MKKSITKVIFVNAMTKATRVFAPGKKPSISTVAAK
jgi:hypothetical protein